MLTKTTSLTAELSWLEFKEATKIFLFFYTVQADSGATRPHGVCGGGCREGGGGGIVGGQITKLTTPTTAKVKNEWSYTSSSASDFLDWAGTVSHLFHLHVFFFIISCFKDNFIWSGGE
jgi:hypothetical protein